MTNVDFGELAEIQHNKSIHKLLYLDGRKIYTTCPNTIIE
jgi:hypothetical protein